MLLYIHYNYNEPNKISLSLIKHVTHIERKQGNTDDKQ